MAISDTQKVDFLWKKIAFAKAKTDTNANKKEPLTKQIQVLSSLEAIRFGENLLQLMRLFLQFPMNMLVLPLQVLHLN